MAVRKRLRFEVLRRDNHTCRYCGSSAPDAVLSVDHVVPKALGGDDQPTNLVAACKDCNAGKSSVPAGAPLVDDVQADAIRWARAMQVAADLAARDWEARDAHRGAFRETWLDFYWVDREGTRRTEPLPIDWEPAVDRFIAAGLTDRDISEAVTAAMGSRADDRFRYFCGVCWRMVADRQAIARNVVGTEPDA